MEGCRELSGHWTPKVVIHSKGCGVDASRAWKSVMTEVLALQAIYVPKDQTDRVRREDRVSMSRMR